jgi:chemotaxis protein methyltransferase CheR
MYLDQLAALMREVAGLRIEPSRYHALRAALARAWPGVPPADVLRRAREPLSATSTISTLVDELTVKETSFLRDRRQLTSIDWLGLHARAVAAGSPVLRVWSAACATGEEPYSLALLACEAFGTPTPPVTILATDVASSALNAVTAGAYRPRALQAVEEPLRSRYFALADGNYHVVPALRELVTVAHHNLVVDPYPPLGEIPFHLLLCRNVLIYFDGETCTQVVAGLEVALEHGGRLMLGAADALCVLDRAVVERYRPPLPRAIARRAVRSKRPRPVVIEPLPRPGDLDLMDPGVEYLRGLDELEAGDSDAAISSLRRVLYLDPEFELAAFALGRAHEEAGEPEAACRRYQQALHILKARPEPDERVAGAIEAATVIDACEARLAVLTDSGAATRAAPTTKGRRA